MRCWTSTMTMPSGLVVNWPSRKGSSSVSLPVLPPSVLRWWLPVLRTQERRSLSCCPIRANVISPPCSMPLRSTHFDNKKEKNNRPSVLTSPHGRAFFSLGSLRLFPSSFDSLLFPVLPFIYALSALIHPPSIRIASCSHYRTASERVARNQNATYLLKNILKSALR